MRARTLRLALVLAVSLVLTSARSASSVDFVTYESITIAASAIGISATTLNPPGRLQQRQCSGRLETAEVRFRFDLVDPTAAEGIALEPLETLDIPDITTALQIRFIRTGATSGVLKVHCWR